MNWRATGAAWLVICVGALLFIVNRIVVVGQLIDNAVLVWVFRSVLGGLGLLFLVLVIEFLIWVIEPRDDGVRIDIRVQGGPLDGQNYWGPKTSWLVATVRPGFRVKMPIRHKPGVGYFAYWDERREL
jgi:hypothetical protein